MARRGQRFNSPAALTGTTQEEKEKTVYIYMTQQHISEVCTWTSEAGMTDLVSVSSSTANIFGRLGFGLLPLTQRNAQSLS